MLAPHSCPCRDWYMNGNYLVILVSITVILPLALMRQLGECGRARALEGDVGGKPGRGPQSHSPSHFAGYLGYSSGFSLSCMVFFLIAVSHPSCWSGGQISWGLPSQGEGRSPDGLLCQGEG